MDEEKVIFPPDFPNFDDEQEDFNIEDFLFEPDPSKIRDISDYDQETDWIPRIDRFGEYLGDGILEPRRKIVKAVFHGFYEDLDKNSEIHLLNNNQLSFVSSSPVILVKEILDPLQIICFNADMLIFEEKSTIANAGPWIASNLNLEGYAPKNKFLIQCFELLRLTHLKYEMAEQMKYLALVALDKIIITNDNFSLISANLLYFILNQKNTGSNDSLDRIEVPIFYSFTKNELLEFQEHFLKLSQSLIVKNYIKFLTELSNVISNHESVLNRELNTSVDSSTGEVVQLIYDDFLDSLQPSFLQFFISGELIQTLHRVYYDRMAEYYNSVFVKLKYLDNTSLQTMAELRILMLSNSTQLYKNLTWGPSLLFLNLAYCFLKINQKLKSLELQNNSHFFINTRRDYIQLLISYSSTLQAINKPEYNLQILEVGKQVVLSNYSANQEKIDYIEYLFFTYYVINIKSNLNKDISEELNFLISYLSNLSQDIIHTPRLTDEIIETGINIFGEFIPKFGYEKIEKLITICPNEVMYILYRRELHHEIPDLQYLIKISQFLLDISEGKSVHSYIYPVEYNYTRDRLVLFINLFSFYFQLGDTLKIEKLRERFTTEFVDKLDFEVFQELNQATLSEKEFINFLLQKSTPQKIYLDTSLVYSLKIRIAITEYLQNGDLSNLIIELKDIILNENNILNFRPKLEGLKLIYRILLRENTNLDLEEVRSEIEEYYHKYSLNKEELSLNPISDSELNHFIPISLTVFLAPLK